MSVVGSCYIRVKDQSEELRVLLIRLLEVACSRLDLIPGSLKLSFCLLLVEGMTAGKMIWS